MTEENKVVDVEKTQQEPVAPVIKPIDEESLKEVFKSAKFPIKHLERSKDGSGRSVYTLEFNFPSEEEAWRLRRAFAAVVKGTKGACVGTYYVALDDGDTGQREFVTIPYGSDEDIRIIIDMAIEAYKNSTDSIHPYRPKTYKAKVSL